MSFLQSLRWLLNFLIYWLAYSVFVILSLLYFPVMVRGRENIPRHGGFIFASNHISNLDPPLLGLCARRRISYLAKDSLFKNKFIGFILSNLDAFPINREGSDVKAIRECLRRLKAGRPVVVFPTGTRVQEGEVQDIKTGIGFLVAKANVPVIPAFILDTDRVIPPGQHWFKRHPVTVIVGKPILADTAAPYPSIAQEIMSRVQSLKPK